MKRFFAFTVIALAIASIGAIVFAQLQNNSQRKTPTLTTDDVARKPSSPASTSTSTATGGSISWETSVESALARAQSGNKLVVVDVYTDWCGWCKRMDQVIYSDASVVSLSRKEVFLKLNAEDGGEGQQFAKKMGVRGFPTTMVLNSEGGRLKSQAGFMQTPQRFISFVESARAGK